MNHPSAASRRRSLLFWAVLLSAVLAVLKGGILVLIVAGDWGGDYGPCSVTSPNGISAESSAQIPPGGFMAVGAENGKFRAFPPARECRLYGTTTERSPAGNLTSTRTLIARRYYPEPSAYLWNMLIIASPILLVLLGRAARNVIRHQLAASRASD
jgi:hypothetical protein